MPRHGLRLSSPVAAVIAGAALALSIMVPALALTGRAPAGLATHAFSLVSSADPRVSLAGREHTVRLTLRNDGTEVWDSRRQFYVSYHWLSLLGAVLELDGMRSPFPHPVPPGGTITLDARVRLPASSGLYRLQWDLVQEHVAWFSDRDPSPNPARLIIALPHLGGTAARQLPVMVLATAAVLAWASRRSSRAQRPAPAFLSVADVVWCVSALWARQSYVMSEADLQPTADALLVGLSVAALAPALTTFWTRRSRLWMVWLLALLATLLALADILYLRYFGDVISVPALLASGQTPQVWGAIKSLLAPRDLWLLPDLLLAPPLLSVIARLPESPSSARRATGMLRIACVCVCLPGVLAVWRGRAEDDRDQIFRNVNVIRELGLFGYHVHDAWRYGHDRFVRAPLTSERLAEVRDWFRRRARHRAGVGSHYGVASGRNVIVIQVESLQQFMVRLRIDGQEVMPNLNRFLDEALMFSRVADQTSEGRTSDGEFVNAISLLPLEHGAVAFRYPANHYVGLPEVLARRGYDTLSAVPFEPSFWNRRLTTRAYGFDRSLFAGDFAPGEEVGWGLNDRDFLRQMASRVASRRQPFLAWLTTLSLHYPFTDFPDDLKVLRVGRWVDRPFGNYVHAMHLFDAAFGEFVGRLKSNGLLDRTVIVVLGDHDAGLSWEGALAGALGFPSHVLDWSLQDKVPLIIRVPGAALRGERNTQAGQTDLGPTLLGLLGVDAAGLPYVGRNLLGEPGGDPIVRPYGDWVDEDHLFLSGQNKEVKRTCYELKTGRAVGLRACQDGSQRAMRQREVSAAVLKYDLQERLAREMSAPQTAPAQFGNR